MNRLVAITLLSILITLPAVPVSAQTGGYGGAMQWYDRAAQEGSAKAQFLRGLLYDRGAGPRKRDPAQAYRWFLKAAEQGHAQAQFKVASALQSGRGVAKNLKLALAWYRRAAAQGGFGPAQLALGYFYLNGTGVVKDAAEAWAWFRAAESRGIAGAAKTRKSTGDGLSQADRKRARTLAAPRLKK